VCSNLIKDGLTTCQYGCAEAEGLPRATGVGPEFPWIIVSTLFPLIPPFFTFYEIGHLLVLRSDFNDFNVRSQNEEMSDLKKSGKMSEDD